MEIKSIKNKLFSQNNLQKDEQQLINSLFDIMLSSLPKPDLLVYLYADVERLQQNIKNRGRSFEQEITNEYLQNIQDRYLDYLRKQTHFPVLLLNVSNVDFTAATVASRSAVFANGMLQVFLSLAGLSNEYVSLDLGLTREPLI